MIPIVAVSETHHGHKQCAYFSNQKEFIDTAKKIAPEDLDFYPFDYDEFLNLFSDGWDEKESQIEFFMRDPYKPLKKKYPNLDDILQHLKNGGEVIIPNLYSHHFDDSLIKKEEFDYFNWATIVFAHDLKFSKVLVGIDEIESYIKHYESIDTPTCLKAWDSRMIKPKCISAIGVATS